MERLGEVSEPEGAGPAVPLDNVALENGAAMRDTIFDKLVSGENDVVGLLAYSLSMQNKRDWLAAFQAETGRAPTPSEMTAYDIGEKIERRLATYRKLAENALAGNSFWASTSLTPVSELPGGYGPAPSAPSTSSYASSSPAPSPPEPKPRGFKDMGHKLTIAGGVFVLLVAAAYAARQWIGV
jgi:hypothetical protein